MNTEIKLSPEMQDTLCCPICRNDLKLELAKYICSSEDCATEYPIVAGVPVLINEENSIFSISDFENQQSTTFNLQQSPLKRFVNQISPSISSNPTSKENYELFVEELLKLSEHPKVLIVGGSVIGHDMKPLFTNQRITLLETDVSFGPRTALICDGHDLPLKDDSFDGVVAQAVLEHVADPYRCTEEMHRILKQNGVVYADTPFMQHGHMGAYDFTRFTHLGHRRLFRKFHEIHSGIGCGPGTAFAWAYQNFLLSFSTQKFIRALLRHFSNLTSFWFKYLDKYLNQKPSAYNTASSHFFLGQKSVLVLSDKELVKQFRGLN